MITRDKALFISFCEKKEYDERLGVYEGNCTHYYENFNLGVPVYIGRDTTYNSTIEVIRIADGEIIAGGGCCRKDVYYYNEENYSKNILKGSYRPDLKHLYSITIYKKENKVIQGYSFSVSGLGLNDSDRGVYYKK